MWTRFMDMHSGGSAKEAPYEFIYIEAPEAEAKVIFYNRFGHNPERVTCTCCGDDYSIGESETLASATAYDRGCEWPKGAKGWDVESGKITVDEYVARKNVLVIPDEEIRPEERNGNIPSQGYVWID